MVFEQNGIMACFKEYHDIFKKDNGIFIKDNGTF